MGRGKAYKEIHFLRVLPEGEHNAITIQEVADKVGCSRALANRNLLALIAKGEAQQGLPGDYGKFTYYIERKRPELTLPMIKDGAGVLRPLNWWLEQIKDKPLPFPLNRILYPVMLQLTISAIGYNNAIPLTEAWVVQKQRLIKNRKVMEEWMGMLDSLLYDPLLNDGSETLEEIAATIKGLWHTIDMTEEELVSLANKEWGPPTNGR